MNLKSLFVLFGALALAAACTNSNIDKLAAADPFQKTITVPNGTGKLTDAVKAELVNDDWQFADNSGKPLAHPRYTMKLTYDQVELCVPRMDPMYDYELLIVDNQTGGRTFAMHGRDCTHTILAQLDAFLTNRKQ